MRLRALFWPAPSPRGFANPRRYPYSRQRLPGVARVNFLGSCDGRDIDSDESRAQCDLEEKRRGISRCSWASPGEPPRSLHVSPIESVVCGRSDVVSRGFLLSPARGKARRHRCARTQSLSSGGSCHRPRCGGRRHRAGAVGGSSLPSRSQRHRFALQHSGWRNGEFLRRRADEWDAFLRAWSGDSYRQRCPVPTRWLRASGFAKRQWSLPCDLPCPCLNPTGDLQRGPPMWRRARRCLYLPEGHDRTTSSAGPRDASNNRLAPRNDNDSNFTSGQTDGGTEFEKRPHADLVG